MHTTLTSKGQVTIPKPIRDALGLQPGQAVAFAINALGEVVLAQATPASRRRVRDRFVAARGKATLPWRTEALMRLLRVDD